MHVSSPIYACIILQSKLMWTAYNQILHKHPLVTKACTSAVMMCASDATIQTYELRDQQPLASSNFTKGYNTPTTQLKSANLPKGVSFVHTPTTNPSSVIKQAQRDWKRTGDVAITGLLYTGPISHAWYSILEKIVKARGRCLNIAIKMLLDAVIFSPVAVAGYFTVRTALEGGDANAIQRKLNKKWRDAYLASLTFWPLANVVNFAFVPLELRVFFNNCLSFIWNGFLSHLNSCKRLESGSGGVVMECNERESRYTASEEVCIEM
uniref:Peroxisomal membrane protein MPV17 n=1 Tax=Ditylum brightwellii TaxID=49249 RepID=A0A7S4UV45_9STRA